MCADEAECFLLGIRPFCVIESLDDDIFKISFKFAPNFSKKFLPFGMSCDKMYGALLGKWAISALF